MCGIIGGFGIQDCFSLIASGLKTIDERGKDGAGYFDGKNLVAGDLLKDLKNTSSLSIIAQNLHAIVNTVPQPFVSADKKSAFVSNCEIYNWKELALEYSITARNDAELLFLLIEKVGVKKALPLLRGVYAFCYWNGDTMYLVRDIIGIKPLWYAFSREGSLAFCSEKKALAARFPEVRELNPREILRYNVSLKKASFLKRSFFSIAPEVTGEEKVLSRVKDLLAGAVSIRIPSRKFGLLFSGGLDSVIILKLLKDLGCSFACYTAATSEDSPDLVWAKKACGHFSVPLKSAIVSDMNDVEKYLQKVVVLIEDSNVMKVGVALPLFIASELARKDGCKVIFSGSGADEVFAGYDRYKRSAPDVLNKDCYADVLKIYEKNSYRDDVVTMHNNLELRVPFLDKEVVSYGLRIAPSLKIADSVVEKYILRRLALELGIPSEFALRKKKAAQYGSGFDKAIGKLAKTFGKNKSAYLSSWYGEPNVKLAALVSGGKDGWLAALIMKEQNYELSCMVSMFSSNPDSYMFHTPAIEMVQLQAKASKIPLIAQKTAGEKESELKDLERALSRAKKEYGIEGVVSGALYSNYQRERIEKVCDRLGLKIFSPLWHIDQEEELRLLLRKKFSVVLTAVAAYGLNKSWLGRKLGAEDVATLVALSKKHGINPAGEGGEFESLVLDCPLFSKKLLISDFVVNEESEHAAHLVVKKASLAGRQSPSPAFQPSHQSSLWLCIFLSCVSGLIRDFLFPESCHNQPEQAIA